MVKYILSWWARLERVVQTPWYLHNDSMALPLASPELGGDSVDCVEENKDNNEDDAEDKVVTKHTVGHLIMIGRLQL